MKVVIHVAKEHQEQKETYTSTPNQEKEGKIQTSNSVTHFYMNILSWLKELTSLSKAKCNMVHSKKNHPRESHLKYCKLFQQIVLVITKGW